MTEAGPLAGVLVVDFGRYVAGPWCSGLLGALGAEVIRVERPGGAEDRHLFPLSDGGPGAYMAQVNRGKQSMTLSPARPGGREVVDALIDVADVIVANLPDATLATLGLSWERVHARNPRAILATATTYDTSGPYGTRLGFDGIGQAMGLSMHLSGHPGEPMKSPVPWVDYQTASYLALAVTAALRDQERHGVGRHVACDLVGSALASAAHFVAEEAALGTGRGGLGNRHPTAGPSDTVPTADGRVLVQVVGDVMFARWCEVVGRPELAGDPRFASDELRGTNGEVLSEVLRVWCSTRSTVEVLDTLAAAGVPAGPVLSAAGALADPQISATLLTEVTMPGLDPPAVVSHAPFRIDGTRPSAGDSVAELGADTDAVLRRIGFDDARITELRAAGTV